MSWTHFSDTRPAARREHRCYLCEETIPVGCVHVARRGVSDGTAVTTRMHLDCVDLTLDWDQRDWDDFDPGAFRDDLAAARAEEDPRRSPSPPPTSSPPSPPWRWSWCWSWRPTS